MPFRPPHWRAWLGQRGERAVTASRLLWASAGVVLILLVGCGAGGGVYHRVGDGQTLYRISRTYGVDENYLARINGISDPTRLRTGDKIFIPGATRTLAVPLPGGKAPPSPPPAAPSVAKAPPANPAKTLPPTLPPATPAAKPSVLPAPPRKEVASTTGGTSAAKPPATTGRFLWPLRGPLLRRFGSGGGTSGKGLEIGAPVNTPVVAAAAGRVIYSGDGISSYGNLIIVKHDDTFFTVYGYNARNLVSSGTFVSKGEKIALAGTPPGGGKPRLYFEIRYGKEAVDPTIYLP
ncbi:MAG TPA: hypothetical protein DEB35_01565 [Desulfuromonas sp.]|nr:hypothetical protein [Desulfuromonas sp.]